MAQFIPPDPPAGIPNSELKVWRGLAKLDDSWVIFHSVAWQSARGGRQADGEADFVLLHRNHGIVILEVKGGGLDIVGGKWFSTDRNGVQHSIKNPFHQAKDSKHALIRYLDELGIRGVGACHGVAFPDTTCVGAIGPEGPRQIIMDGNDLADCRSGIGSLVAHWNIRSNRLASITLVLRIASLQVLPRRACCLI